MATHSSMVAVIERLLYSDHYKEVPLCGCCYREVPLLPSSPPILIADGTMYSWGRGRGGRLGMDTEEDVFEPRKIPFEFPSHHVQGLSCCHGVTMLLTVPQ